MSTEENETRKALLAALLKMKDTDVEDLVFATRQGRFKGLVDEKTALDVIFKENNLKEDSITPIEERKRREAEKKQTRQPLRVHFDNDEDEPIDWDEAEEFVKNEQMYGSSVEPEPEIEILKLNTIKLMPKDTVLPDFKAEITDKKEALWSGDSSYSDTGKSYLHKMELSNEYGSVWYSRFFDYPTLDETGYHINDEFIFKDLIVKKFKDKKGFAHMELNKKKHSRHNDEKVISDGKKQAKILSLETPKKSDPINHTPKENITPINEKDDWTFEDFSLFEVSLLSSFMSRVNGTSRTKHGILRGHMENLYVQRLIIEQNKEIIKLLKTINGNIKDFKDDVLLELNGSDKKNA